MSRGDGVVREIDWNDVFPSLLLVRALKLATGVRMLLLAAAALYFIALGWWLVGKIFENRDERLLRRWIDQQTVMPWREFHGTYLEIDDPVPTAVSGRAEAVPFVRIPDNAIEIFASSTLAMWTKFSAPFINLFHPHQTITGLAYCILCCLWALLVLGLFGGAMARTAALSLTRREAIGWRPSLSFAWSKLGSFMAAPLLPVGAVLLGMLLLALPAMPMRLDFGVLLAGIVWPLVLLIGLLMTIVLLGVWFGWPLMWPAIATEGSEAFDALNRAYAYIYQRPLRYLGYLLFALLLGTIGTLLVNLFAGLILYFSDLAVTWGAGAERMEDLRRWASAGGDAPGNMASAGATLIAFWRNLVLTIAFGFQLAFFLCAASGIYLLLRRSVDATELDEVYLDEDRAYGLPSLEKDSAGVPGVAPAPPASPGAAASQPAAATPPEAASQLGGTDVAGDD